MTRLSWRTPRSPGLLTTRTLFPHAKVRVELLPGRQLAPCSSWIQNATLLDTACRRHEMRAACRALASRGGRDAADEAEGLDTRPLLLSALHRLPEQRGVPSGGYQLFTRKGAMMQFVITNHVVPNASTVLQAPRSVRLREAARPLRSRRQQ